MAGVLNSIVQSDIPEQIAAGVEGATRGILPTGVASMISHAAGAGPEYEARAAKYSKTSQLGEAAGNIARDTASVAAAGPIGMFSNAALNTAGQVADNAYNHDPRLTREHIAQIAAKEALGAGLGLAGGKAMEYLAPTGKYIMKQSGERLGKMLMNSNAAKILSRVGRLDELVDLAVKQGVFTSSREAALASSKAAQKSIGADMDTFLASADSVAAGKPPVPGMHSALQGELRNALKQLKQSGTPRAVAAIKSASKDLGEDFTPSQLERMIKNIGATVNPKDGYTTGVVTQLKQNLKNLADTNLKQLGHSSDALRELETQYSAQVALQKSVPKFGAKDLLKTGAKLAAVAGAEQGAEHLGAPKWATRGVGLAAEGAVAMHGRGQLAGAGRTVAGAALSTLYAGGKSLSNFDKTVFAQFLGRQLGQTADKAAASVAAGVTKRAILPSAEQSLKLATQYAQNPDSFHRAAYNHVDASGTLPTEHADLAANDIANLFDTMNYNLPPKVTSANPISPPAARRLSASQTLKLRQTVHALHDPIGALMDGNQTGVGVVKSQHPATYEAFVNGLMHRVGPNAPITHPARRVIERLGLDMTRRRTAAAVQQIYAAPLPQPPGKGARKPAQTQSFISKTVQSSPTHNEQVQEDEN